jgi:hypothetical protein
VPSGCGGRWRWLQPPQSHLCVRGRAPAGWVSRGVSKPSASMVASLVSRSMLVARWSASSSCRAGEAGNAALLVAPHGAKGAPLSATKSVSSVKGVVD